MKISTKGRYALKVMLDLALHNNGEYIAAKDISSRQGITPKYMEQIISAKPATLTACAEATEVTDSPRLLLILTLGIS